MHTLIRYLLQIYVKNKRFLQFFISYVYLCREIFEKRKGLKINQIVLEIKFLQRYKEIITF